jgi:hypothetical protein
MARDGCPRPAPSRCRRAASAAAAPLASVPVVDVVGRRIVVLRVLLGRRAGCACRRASPLRAPDRLLAADEERHDHVRERRRCRAAAAPPSSPWRRSRCRAAAPRRSTTSSEITTSSTPSSAGSSNMVSSRIASMIERRPRAPVLRSMARLAMRRQRVLVEGQFDILHLEQALVLLDQRVLRLGQDLDQRRSSRSSSVASTGRRPTNSGIRPNFSRSSGSTWRNSSPVRRSSGEAHAGAEADRGLAAAVRR